jgi:DNA repair exonuclease SbcCD ATPase subunit
MVLLKRWGARTESQPQSDPVLERLVARVQSERENLEIVLASVTGVSAGIPEMQVALDDAGGRASALSDRIDDLTTRVDTLGRTTHTIEQLEQRLASLETTLAEAETRASQTIRRATEIDRRVESMDQLVSMAANMLAKVEALNRDAIDIERLETQLPVVREEYQHVLNQQAALSGDVDRLHRMTTALIAETATSREMAHDVRQNADRAAETIADVQRKLDAVCQLETLTCDTTAQLQTLNALAEHATSKVKALEQQHQTIEHALVESRKVTEMVWHMDVQIGRLNEGSTQAARVEENLSRLDVLHKESTVQLDEAFRARQRFTETFERQRCDATELLQALQLRLDHLAVNRTEIETLRERVESAQSTLHEVEHRLGGASTAGETVKSLREQVNELSMQLSELAAQAETLCTKQMALSMLEGRLEEADATAKRMVWQLEAVDERRRELDRLKAAFEQFDAMYAHAQGLTETLRTDKHELAHFVEQTAGFLRDAPQIAAHVESLKASVAEAEASAVRAIAIKPGIDALASQAELLTPRLQIVDHLQARLGELHALCVEVERKLETQLARHAEIEGVRIACDGLSTRLTDAQHMYATLADAQSRLAPIPDQISQLETDLRATGSRLDALRQDDDAIDAQDRRLRALNDSAGALTHDLAGRLDALRGLQAELAQASALKVQVCDALAEMQRLQREILETTRDAQDQLQHVAARCQHIDQQRAHVELAERGMTVVAHRIEELERFSGSVDAKIDAIAGRERIIDAVKHEVETIHAVARKAQEDLAASVDGYSHLAEGRAEVQRLLDALADAASKIADVEARGRLVDDVRRKADAVIHLLEDMRVALDSVSEQKAVIDHVSDQLVRLDEVITEARGTRKALQGERKLAQRIVENIRSVHARVGAESEQMG